MSRSLVPSPAPLSPVTRTWRSFATRLSVPFVRSTRIFGTTASLRSSRKKFAAALIEERAEVRLLCAQVEKIEEPVAPPAPLPAHLAASLLPPPDSAETKLLSAMTVGVKAVSEVPFADANSFRIWTTPKTRRPYSSETTDRMKTRNSLISKAPLAPGNFRRRRGNERRRRRRGRRGGRRFGFFGNAVDG